MNQETKIIARHDSVSTPALPNRPPPFAGIAPPEPQLSPQKSKAVHLLSEGKTFTEVAEAVRVNRGTIFRWRTTDPNFIAALNCWRASVQAETRDRVLALGNNATTAVAKSIAEGNAGLGLKVLDKMGCLKVGPDSPLDPYAVFGAGLEDEIARHPAAEGFARVSAGMTPEQKLRAPQILAMGVVIENMLAGHRSAKFLLEMAAPIPTVSAGVPAAGGEAERNSAPINDADSRTTVESAPPPPMEGKGWNPPSSSAPRRRQAKALIYDATGDETCIRYVARTKENPSARSTPHSRGARTVFSKK